MSDSKSLWRLLEILRQKNLKLGLAESCTGGLLSAQLAAIAGVSDTYLGGVVSYSNQVKVDLLGVKEDTLNKFGAVSEETAREMVRGACGRLKVDCAIAITGIAGPTGGSKDKPVGTVFIAIKGPDFEKAKREIFAGSRIEVQTKSVDGSIKYLLDQLLNA